MGTITRRGTVHTDAEGRRWLFLHGTPLTPSVWHDVTRRDSGIGGRVATPSIDGPGDAAARAARLAERLDDEPAHVVGHSFGGQVAIELALQRPDLVQTVTLLCTRATPYPAFADAAASLRRGERPDPDVALTRWFTPAELASGSPVLGYARRCVTEGDLSAWADALDSIARFDRLDALSERNVPMSVIAAEHDRVSSPEVMRDLADRCGGAFHQLDGTGHMGPFLDPQRVVRLLRGQVAPTSSGEDPQTSDQVMP